MRYVPTARVREARQSVGKPFRQGSSTLRWFEHPERSCGLRSEGYCDEVSRDAGYYRMIDHKGWFLEDDGCMDELARGVVFALRWRGEWRFLAGMEDPFNGKAALIAVDTFYDDRLEAAQAADRIAEVYAEEERDYRRASHAKLQYDEKDDEVAAIRRRLLGTFHAEGRAARASYTPELMAVFRGYVTDALEQITQLRKERVELKAEFHREQGWKDN